MASRERSSASNPVSVRLLLKSSSALNVTRTCHQGGASTLDATRVLRVVCLCPDLLGAITVNADANLIREDQPVIPAALAHQAVTAAV